MPSSRPFGLRIGAVSRPFVLRCHADQFVRTYRLPARRPVKHPRQIPSARIQSGAEPNRIGRNSGHGFVTNRMTIL
ncbi:hypothetical protein BST29_09335 [Mycobacterium malmoense]|uniref:Uncharacterized protein n=1 Tax=Mycobacterium malmoense TaxID=1780 RepID=A0ABX3STG4_MYCMA|nr:hypothetical protein BST29_09335 [Mycobacterium malmoense]